MAGLPGKLEALPRRIDLALVFDPLSGGGQANDIDVFAGAAQRAVKRASVPGGNRLVGHAEPQQKSPAREVLQGSGLDSQSDRTAAVNMINGRPHFERASARRDCRKQNQRVGAVRFAFPECAEAGLLNQRRQLHNARNGIMRSRIEFDVIDHDSSSAIMRGQVHQSPN